MSDLSYPIGRFAGSHPKTHGARQMAIRAIARTPSDLRQVLEGLDTGQLDTPYRPGGWTVRQLAHHVPDSHINAYVRFKLALTEECPQIKPYHEERWAQLSDTRTAAIETSLVLLESLTDRWVRILEAMAPVDFDRRYIHPDTGEQDLDYLLSMYAWHGAHHVAHVARLRERMGWLPTLA